jgi:hypothetical protein
MVSKQWTQMRAVRLFSQETAFLQTGILNETKCKGSNNWWQPLRIFMRLDASKWTSSSQVSNESPKCK